LYIRIPETIDIFGVTYVVRFGTELDGNRVAQIHFTEGVIDVASDMSNDICFVSFIHEVQHGILQGMNYFMSDRIYHDESFVERMSQGWSQVIKQIIAYNFDIDYLYEMLKEEEDEMPEKDTLNIPVGV
jgi:hypothetical protein